MAKWTTNIYLRLFSFIILFSFGSIVYIDHAKTKEIACNVCYDSEAPINEMKPTSNVTSCVTGRPCTYLDVVDLRLIVITFNRPQSLLKLLNSLDTLVLDGDKASLEVWIDRDRHGAVDKQTVEVASSFVWRGGSTRVHVQVY